MGTLPLMITSKLIKDPSIHLTKQMEELYNENFQISEGRYLGRQKELPCSCIRVIAIVNMIISQNQIQIQWGFQSKYPPNSISFHNLKIPQTDKLNKYANTKLSSFLALLDFCDGAYSLSTHLPLLPSSPLLPWGPFIPSFPFPFLGCLHTWSCTYIESKNYIWEKMCRICLSETPLIHLLWSSLVTPSFCKWYNFIHWLLHIQITKAL